MTSLKYPPDQYGRLPNPTVPRAELDAVRADNARLRYELNSLSVTVLKALRIWEDERKLTHLNKGD